MILQRDFARVRLSVILWGGFEQDGKANHSTTCTHAHTHVPTFPPPLMKHLSRVAICGMQQPELPFCVGKSVTIWTKRPRARNPPKQAAHGSRSEKETRSRKTSTKMPTGKCSCPVERHRDCKSVEHAQEAADTRRNSGTPTTE